MSGNLPLAKLLNQTAMRTVPMGKMTRYRCHLGCILLKTARRMQCSDIVVHRTRGGGGGLFFPLPKAPGAAEAEGPFTHMLQSDFPGKSDGTAFCRTTEATPFLIWPRVSSR